MTALYLLCVAASLATLAALLLRQHPAPTPPPTPVPSPAALPVTATDDVRVILTAAARLAIRLDTAA